MTRLLPFLLGSFLLVSGMAQAVPSETEDLQNTAPSPVVQPETAVTPPAVVPDVPNVQSVQPGVVPGTVPNNIQVQPETSTTVIMPDTNMNPNITITTPSAVPTTPVPAGTLPTTPVVPLPEQNATQPVLNQPVVVPEVKVVPEQKPEQKSQTTIPLEVKSVPEEKSVSEPPKVVAPVITPVPTTPTPPVKVLSPADFLVKTPEKKPEPPKEPEKKPAPVKEPEKKPVPPTKEPEKKSEPPKEPEKKLPPVKQPKKPAKNDPLMIPEEAKKTGSLDFLEGCWKGTRPEYHTKRIVTERFCFDKRGIGKRTINDPTGGQQCVGPTVADMRKNGSLHMSSESAPCTSGEEWGAAEMVCTGEGNSTPCTWKFPDINGAQQSYKIHFVRD